MDEWMQKMSNGILFSLFLKVTSVICDNMDEPGAQCAK
jgi:hypothetical protein